jgi:hypothetical protein
MIESDDISNNSTQSSTLCSQCSRYPRSVVLIPCGHFIVCVACGHSLVSCPICQSDINAILKIFEWFFFKNCISNKSKTSLINLSLLCELLLVLLHSMVYHRCSWSCRKGLVVLSLSRLYFNACHLYENVDVIRRRQNVCTDVWGGVSACI